jgi:NADP-dependent 3-hydroxy acid dehydrogenase YdfG
MLQWDWPEHCFRFGRGRGDVVLAARKLPDLEPVAQGITQMGRRALPVSANIRYLPEIDNLVKRAVDESHHVDILVNNAYINPVFASVRTLLSMITKTE